MPYSFMQDQPSRRLAGIAANSGRPGDAMAISTNGFASSDEGEHFLRVVEELVGPLLRHAPTPTPESQVDHLFATFRANGRVDVWLNEVSLIAQTQMKGRVEKNAPVFRDHLADIRSVRAEGLSIPDECGFVILVSSGWRKAALYDFRPLAPGCFGSARPIAEWLAAAYSWLVFSNRLRLSEGDWCRLLAQRWFPFVSLPEAITNDILNYARNGWDIDELDPRITEAALSRLADLRQIIQIRPLFERHRGVLLEALDCFEKGQHKIAVHGLYMRIEGVLRDRHFVRGEGGPAQPALCQATQLNDITHHLSPLLPNRFQTYLSECFFTPQNFDNPADATAVSRNSLAHGVVHSDLVDEKAATIGVLILHQLAYLFAEPA